MAEAGDADAQCHIASFYHAGLGVAANGLLAVCWYLKAAMQEQIGGNISGIAYHNLATIFTTGMPQVAVEHERAAEYLRKAAGLGVELIPASWGSSRTN